MKAQKYSKEELEIIKKWGIPSDKEFDTSRKVFSANGNVRITALILAKQRRDILEGQGLNLVSNHDFQKAG